MTQINVAITVPTPDGTGKRPTGTTSWKPTKRRTVGDDVVLPAPFNVGITDPPSTAEVAPTEPGWAWEVVERVSGGSPHKRLLAVPDSPTVVDYADLVELDPVTLTNAWWTQVTDAIAGGDFATNTDLTNGLSTKVNSSTYTAGLAAKSPADPVLSNFSYDPATGNLLSYQEDGITITLTYNSDGTVATSKRGSAPAKTYSYSNGNLVGVA